jgi:hypothetical protein
MPNSGCQQVPMKRRQDHWVGSSPLQRYMADIGEGNTAISYPLGIQADDNLILCSSLCLTPKRIDKRQIIQNSTNCRLVSTAPMR